MGNPGVTKYQNKTSYISLEQTLTKRFRTPLLGVIFFQMFYVPWPHELFTQVLRCIVRVRFSGVLSGIWMWEGVYIYIPGSMYCTDVCSLDMVMGR